MKNFIFFLLHYFFLFSTTLSMGKTAVVVNKNILILNECKIDIWPIIITYNGDLPRSTSTNGKLKEGQRQKVGVDQAWEGQVQGQTGNVSSPHPATVATFSFSVGNFDYYEISLFYGYNVPIEIRPKSVESFPKCYQTGCSFDLSKCPVLSQNLDRNNTIVGCNGICGVKKDNCCSRVDKARVKSFEETTSAFSSSCPQARASCLDGSSDNHTMSCHTKSVWDYEVTFCPSSLLKSRLPTNNRSKQHRVKAIYVVLPIVFIILIIGVAIGFKWRKAKKPTIDRLGSVRKDLVEVNSLEYNFAIVEAATNNFAPENKVGAGGFGSVYKGILPNGQEVAVKRLSITSTQGSREFKAEVLLLAKLQHRRLVRLLGFSMTQAEKLLIYEHVPNKSLDLYLFDSEKKLQLNWNTRFRIIKEIARGILYLHQDSYLRVIHRDIKPSNILLDLEMNPKIADFGLAKVCSLDQSRGSTSRGAGTLGYMAPELAMFGECSTKSDVYSFGVLILEILCGVKNTTYENIHDESLFIHAWTLWNEDKTLEFVDATIAGECMVSEVKLCMHLALACIQKKVDDRPTMHTAVVILDGQTITIPPPKKPNTPTNSIGESPLRSPHSSINGVTITDVEAR